ncbi:MAG: helix-turn-helix transcriptional regulator [Colwellia sp.]
MAYTRDQVLGWANIAYGYNVTPKELAMDTGLNLNLLENSQLNYYSEQKAVVLLLSLLNECGFYKNDEINIIELFFNQLILPQSLNIYKNFNVFFMALMNQPNFISNLNLIITFSNNTYKQSKVSYKTNKNYTYIKHDIPGQERAFVTSQGALHGINQIIKKTAPYIDLYPEFLFTSKTIPNIDKFTQHNGCKIKFLQPFSGIKFKTKLLEVKNPFFNPLVTNYTNNMVSEVFLTFKPQQVLTEQVRGIVNSYFNNTHNQVINIKQVCQEVHMSSATLQRHLAKEDQSFSNILEEQRRINAMKLIQHSNSELLQISESLGYSNFSSFNRAFKRWFGDGPLAFRKS